MTPNEIATFFFIGLFGWMSPRVGFFLMFWIALFSTAAKP